MTEWVQSLPKELIEKSRRLIPEINRLRHYLESTGKIKKIGPGARYEVVEDCPEIKQLIKHLKDLKTGGIEIIYKKK